MAPATRRTDASSSAAAAHAEAAAASVPRQLTEAEKDELRAELWDEFRNDHYESMEMLPLQLRRQSALLRELDEHASTELQRVQQLTRQYLELRTRLANGDIPESSEVNTRTLLAQIGAALNEYMRTAEEKVSIANNAYDSVDRHVRAMDGLIKEQDEVNNAGVRKVVFGYQQRPVTVTGHVEPEPEPAVVQKPTLDMPIDPNEPRYCLCQNVSYGEMIACDNGDDCPYEWFHYACVGLTEEPKGGAQWFCPDCKAKLSKRRK